MNIRTDKLPSVLPAIVDVTVMCSSCGHESYVVCGKCHTNKLKETFGVTDPRWEIESLRSRNRLLRGTVLHLAVGFVVVSAMVVFMAIWGSTS